LGTRQRSGSLFVSTPRPGVAEARRSTGLSRGLATIQQQKTAMHAARVQAAAQQQQAAQQQAALAAQAVQQQRAAAQAASPSFARAGPSCATEVSAKSPNACSATSGHRSRSRGPARPMTRLAAASRRALPTAISRLAGPYGGPSRRGQTAPPRRAYSGGAPASNSPIA
jgi:hypothetical protein